MRALTLACSALLLAGCSTATPIAGPTGSTAGPTGSVASTPAAPTPSASATPEIRVITITLRDGGVSPNAERISLTRGERVLLEITSDRHDVVHVHGLEKEIALEAGDRKRVSLDLDRTGRFEIESHHPARVIVVLQVR
jgi:hypothetical protein